MGIPLDKTLKIGVSTMLRRTEPATGPWTPNVDELVDVVTEIDRLGFDAFWCGDHIAFAIPILDPLTQIAQAAVASRRLTFGTAVFLLPLRHPTPVAKQIATLDLLTGGRFIFGVGWRSGSRKTAVPKVNRRLATAAWAICVSGSRIGMAKAM